MGDVVVAHDFGHGPLPVEAALERASRAPMTKQQRLEACVQSILLRPDLPAFSHQVFEVLSMVNDEGASLNRLTRMVLHNYGLTAQLLRAANSMYYNRSGRPILSASHAITYLGWDTIRDMAGGMLLFEHFQQRRRTPGLKEMVLCSLLTANHAREISTRLNYPRREEAYLCGMFRNLGEVLAAAYLPDRYAEVLREVHNQKPAPAIDVSRVLGFNFDELAVAVLRYWNLPEKVGLTMAMPDIVGDQALDENDQLRLITGFSHLLSTAVYRGDPARSREATRQLLKKFSTTLALTQQDLEGVLKSAVRETKAIFDAAFIPLDQLRLERQIELALMNETPPKSDPIAAPPASEPEDETVKREDALGAMTARVQGVLSSGSDFDLNDLLYMVLESIYRGGRFDRVILALLTPDRTAVEGRLGVGDGIDRLIEAFRFPISIRSGPIAPAMIGHQSLFISMDSDGRYENSTFQQVTGANYFGLLPIILDRLTIGCLYFDRLTPAPPPNDREETLLLILRDAMATAIARKRSATSTTARI